MSAKEIKVFIADDGSVENRLLRLALTDAGYETTTTADNGFDPLSLRCSPPAVILVDIQQAVAETLQKLYWLKTICKVPVIALIAKDRTNAIDQSPVAIDHCLYKPFKLENLVELINGYSNRCSACVYQPAAEPGEAQSTESRPTRAEATSPKERAYPDLHLLRLDMEAKDIFVDHTPLNLSPKEFKLFELLVTKSGGVVTDDEIANALWPSQSYVSDTEIRQYVYRVRRKFERRVGSSNGNLIENVKGRGYRLLHGFTHAEAA